MDIKNLPIEELLDVARKSTSNVSKDDSKSIVNFVKRRQIMMGECLVPTYKVYYEYCKTIQPIDRLSKIHFFRAFSKYFKSHRRNNQRYYLLNDCFDMSTEGLNKAKDYEKRFKK